MDHCCCQPFPCMLQPLSRRCHPDVSQAYKPARAYTCPPGLTQLDPCMPPAPSCRLPTEHGAPFMLSRRVPIRQGAARKRQQNALGRTLWAWCRPEDVLGEPVPESGVALRCLVLGCEKRGSGAWVA
ncbi:hypothetical protein CERSUDRAFT_111099 [Gelatoporia subvermispora B]|uniref:Uncharacterized protein n=1 Tax=Ceriporiopsis subvermispora (strain B) TaxID=914234 RepID=M2QTW2_CERS8|nr:hypothetical protein CERSUDRAFT_111099 [Gelatoporia subvermispora B]